MLGEKGKHLLDHGNGLALLAFADGVGIHTVKHELVQNIERALHLRRKRDLGVGVFDCGDHQRIDARGLAFAQRFAHIRRNVAFRQHTAADSVVDVVVQIRNTIGKLDDPPLQRVSFLAARMANDAVTHFKSQVQAAPFIFKLIHHTQRLLVMAEPFRQNSVQRALTGVTERGMAEVVAERDRFGQILVECEADSNGARDLRNFQRMCQPGAVMVGIRREKHLRFVLQAAKRIAMDDAVAVTLKRGTHTALGLFPCPSLCVFAQ